MKVCLLSGPSLLFLAALVAPGQFAKAATAASVSKTPTAEKASDPKKSESPSLESATLERAAAEQSKTELGKSGPFKKPIVTEITAATKFYPAEDYHQHYYKKNPVRYRYYRNACGRDQDLDKVWGARRLGEHP